MTTTHKHFLGLIFGIVLGLNFLSGCGGGGGGSHSSTPVTLASIEVTPVTPSIAIGTAQQFKATGIYSDKTKKDLTSSVTWSSTDTTKATVSDTAGSKGLVTSVAAGTTTIKATSGTISGSTTLTVKAATVILDSIEVTPTNPSIALGTAQQFTATGIFSDNSRQDLTTQVAWSSLDASVATIDDKTGLATSFAAGSTTITATSTLGGTPGSTTLKVTVATLSSIGVTPTNPSIALGTTQQFTATGVFSDGINITTQDLTTQVAWSSSNIGVATIDNTGLATSVSAGSTTVTAALGSVSGNTTLTVTSATLVSIGISPTNPSISLGTTQQFTATGVFSDGTNITSQDLTTLVIWGSGTLGVATISNAPGSEGLATSVATGSTTITATLGSISGSTLLTVTAATLSSIEVTPTNQSLPKGLTLQYTATGIYSDNTTQDLTTQVTWISTNEAAATISNASGSKGLVTAVGAEQTTTIKAALGDFTPGETTLTVTAATLSSIEVTPTNQSLPKGLTLQYTATGIYSDNTTQDLTSQVTWSSANTSIASVSNASGSEGLATAVNVGATSIRATLGSVYEETALTVTAATLSSITVTPTNQNLPKGLTLQYTATGTYSDSTTQDLTTQVTWSSSAETVATISNAKGTEGLATAINLGPTTITATFGGKSGSTTLTVTAATLSSITVTPANQTMALGTKLQYTATGIFSDTTQLDLTKQVTWSSSNTGVAVISNGTQTKGLATAIGAGSTTITATFGGKTGETNLTVTTTAFSSIEVIPANRTIAVGDKLQFTAIGHFPDGSTQDLTLSSTWSSSNKTFATVSNARKTRGQATGVSAGTTTIRATEGGVYGTASLTVQ